MIEFVTVITIQTRKDVVVSLFISVSSVKYA